MQIRLGMLSRNRLGEMIFSNECDGGKRIDRNERGIGSRVIIELVLNGAPDDARAIAFVEDLEPDSVEGES